MNGTAVAIGGVALVPLIVALIQFAKRFASSAPGNVWLGASFVLGVIGQIVTWIIALEAPVGAWTLEQWAVVVVLGLNFGLAASKAYDEAEARPESAAGRAVRSLAGE